LQEDKKDKAPHKLKIPPKVGISPIFPSKIQAICTDGHHNHSNSGLHHFSLYAKHLSVEQPVIG